MVTKKWIRSDKAEWSILRRQPPCRPDSLAGWRRDLLPIKPLQHRSDLNAGRGAQARIPRVKALRRDYAKRDLFGRERFAGRKPQRLHAEP